MFGQKYRFVLVWFILNYLYNKYEDIKRKQEEASLVNSSLQIIQYKLTN